MLALNWTCIKVSSLWFSSLNMWIHGTSSHIFTMIWCLVSFKASNNTGRVVFHYTISWLGRGIILVYHIFLLSNIRQWFGSVWGCPNQTGLKPNRLKLLKPKLNRTTKLLGRNPNPIKPLEPRFPSSVSAST